MGSTDRFCETRADLIQQNECMIGGTCYHWGGIALFARDVGTERKFSLAAAWFTLSNHFWYRLGAQYPARRVFAKEGA